MKTEKELYEEFEELKIKYEEEFGDTYPAGFPAPVEPEEAIAAIKECLRTGKYYNQDFEEEMARKGEMFLY